jgi:hypothetical protein
LKSELGEEEISEVGRTKLLSIVFGQFFHIAEHTQCHTGQIITTARIALELTTYRGFKGRRTSHRIQVLRARLGGQAIPEKDQYKQEEQSHVPGLSRVELFLIFLKAGLAFGGGLGILAVLEDELVSKHRVVSKEEFLTIYGIGRIVPSGTMTALAVTYGYKFAGMSGTLIALAALALPVFLLTIALTVAYHYLRDS